VLASLFVLATVAGCDTGSPQGSVGGGSAPAPVVQLTAPAPKVTITPQDGDRTVRTDARVKVVVEHGKLASVTVAGKGAPKVAGKLSSDRTSWTATSGLRYGTRYTTTVRLAGTSADPVTSAFATAPAKKLLTTSISPLTGSQVGVGMPIVVKLSVPVTARAAVERGLVVTASEDVEGSWSWISDEELHYRPESFWPAGTDVRLDVRLAGVDAGKGVTGGKDRTVSFHVGASMVSTVDVKALRMTVERDGRVVRTIPVTAGKAGFLTRAGIKVVSEKFRTKTMDAATINIDKDDPEYYRLKVEYAMRVTWSGEFVHGAPWSVSDQGRARVSHGCVGMSLADSKWLFEQSSIGDVIKVVNSPRTLEPQNGWTDWNVDWDTWRSGSALAAT
jgi:lipoprotein-anchoring transpeptidase ErfK/SrfK